MTYEHEDENGEKHVHEGITLHTLEIPMEDGDHIIGWTIQLKVFRPETGVGYTTLQSGDITDVEALGMTIAHTESLKREIHDAERPRNL